MLVASGTYSGVVGMTLINIAKPAMAQPRAYTDNSMA